MLLTMLCDELFFRDFFLPSDVREQMAESSKVFAMVLYANAWKVQPL